MLRPDDTILCLGDSLTAGYRLRADDSYPAVLQRLTGRVVVNGGRCGDTAERAATRLPRLLDACRPALVLAGVGGNDFLHRLPAARTQHALERIVDTTRAAGAEIVLIAVPRANLLALFGALFDHELYHRVAAAHGVRLFRRGWASALAPPHCRLDAVHPNARGHRRFAERLAGWLHDERLV